jgi:hypothetical protein
MKVSLALIFFLLGFSLSTFSHVKVEDKEIFNIYEYEMVLEAGEISQVYYSNERCYTTWVEYSHNKNFYFLKSENFDIKFHVVKFDESIVKDKNGNVLSKIFKIFAARCGSAHPYQIMEITNNDKFYLSVTPIRFNHKSGIDERGIVISKENICRIP